MPRTLNADQVRSLARLVKLDVQEVTQLCPVQHPRAVRFLRRWACERLATLAGEILVSRAAAALERWRRAAAAMAMAERKEAYLRYQGSSKLMFSLDKAYLRRLAKGWIQWGVFLEAERARERRVLEQSAAITIQRAVRGFHARRLRAWLKIVAQDQERHRAAVTLTVYAKGKVARMRYARVKAGIERVRAGELLRRVGRGMLGRTKAKRLREERARLKARRSNETPIAHRRALSIFFAARLAARPAESRPVSSIRAPPNQTSARQPSPFTQLFSVSINYGCISPLHRNSEDYSAGARSSLPRTHARTHTHTHTHTLGIFIGTKRNRWLSVCRSSTGVGLGGVSSWLSPRPEGRGWQRRRYRRSREGNGAGNTPRSK